MKIPKNFWQFYKLDFLLLINEKNRLWFSEFSASQGFILISKKEKKAWYFLDSRYFDEGKKKAKNCEVRTLKSFADVWTKINGKIGCEEQIKWLNVQQLSRLNKKIKLQIVNVRELRMIKDKKEIAKLRHVCSITAKIWNKIAKTATMNHTEFDIKIMIKREFLKEGISKSAFEPIVSSGLRSKFIHTTAQKQKIESHLLCDFGGNYQGYNSDFTRVLIFGKNKKVREKYALISKLQKKIIDLIKPGVKIMNLAKIAEKFYKDNNLKEEHSLGHGVGLEVHELPNIVGDSPAVLMEGMVITIEPGIYSSDFGGVRIEDTVLVTHNGCKILTQTK